MALEDEQLSALDSVFLSLETPEIPGHIGGLAILDPSTHPELAFDANVFTYRSFVLGQLAYQRNRYEEARRYLEAFVRRTESSRRPMKLALAGEGCHEGMGVDTE